MYGEYFYDLKDGEIGPILQVLASLRSWSERLTEEQKKKLDLEDYYQDSYSKLAQEYSEVDENNILRYLCLYRLGDFYTLQGKSERRYETFKVVSEGLQEILGRENPLVLKARFMFIACLPPRREYEKALEQATEISELQEKICELEKEDYWKTLQLIADVQFYMTRFEVAAATQAKVVKGWQGVATAKRFNKQISDMMSGHIFEARGILEDALITYELVEKLQNKVYGDKDVLTLYACVSMASIYRKQKRFEEARKRFVHALTERQILYGEKNKSVVDTMIQIIILDREEGRSLDYAQALIDMLRENGSLDDKYERYCQVQHLQAILFYDQEQPEDACKVLRTLLHEQTEDSETNNRPLLWVRLTLATILREQGEDDEASSLFMDIVTSTVRGDVSPSFESVDFPRELEIAEKALRYVRDKKQYEADHLLQEHDLQWKRQSDFWMLEGIPSADTASMKGP